MSTEVQSQASGVALRCKSWDHGNLPAMDLWRAERFYTHVLDGAITNKLGMTFRAVANGGPAPAAFIEFGRANLGFFLQGRHEIPRPPALTAPWPCWAFEVADEELDGLVARIRAEGMEVLDDTAALHGPIAKPRCVRTVDTEGNCIELIAAGGGKYNGYAVKGLDHVHVEATDVQRSVDFYTRYLGFEVVGEGPALVALRVPSGQHWFLHEVAELSPASAVFFRGAHFAFLVDEPMFEGIRDRVRADGLEEGPTFGPPEQRGGFARQYGAASAVNAARVEEVTGTYFPAPDGVWVEIIGRGLEEAYRGKPKVRYVVS